MPVKGWIVVNDLYCKGCELCVEACPKDVLALDLERLSSRGYHPVRLIADGCTGCNICGVICPDVAITVYRESRQNPKVAVTS